MTPEKKLELARINLELSKATRVAQKDPSSENRSRVVALQKQYTKVRLGPATPKAVTPVRAGDTRTAMRLTPREPQPVKTPGFVHRPDVEWCDAVNQWVGV